MGLSSGMPLTIFYDIQKVFTFTLTIGYEEPRASSSHNSHYFSTSLENIMLGHESDEQM
jgi:hypothetical protein